MYDIAAQCCHVANTTALKTGFEFRMAVSLVQRKQSIVVQLGKAPLGIYS